jgi:hypothetical protein
MRNSKFQHRSGRKQHLRTLRTAVVLTATAATLATGIGSAALAAPDSNGAVAAVRARLESFGVTPDVQDQLIQKLLAGEQLDADTDATPVSSTTTTADGIEKTRNVYADGSVAIGRVESPSSPQPAPTSSSSLHISIKSIRGCSHRVDSFGTNIYTGCEVAWDAATWSVSWTADYDYNVNGEAITSAKSVHFGGVGDFAQAGTEIVTLRADKNGTAIADGYVNQKLTVLGVGSTRRVGVRLQVATRWTDRKAKESPFST